MAHWRCLDDTFLFLELKKNHRFLADKPWGDLLTRFRDFGPTVEDVEKINTRVVGSQNGPTEADIPIGATYATKTNKDRMAINDAIFANHLKHTHSKDANVPPPRHTICVMASNLKFKKSGTYNTYYDMNERCKDVIYATYYVWAANVSQIESFCMFRCWMD